MFDFLVLPKLLHTTKFQQTIKQVESLLHDVLFDTYL